MDGGESGDEGTEDFSQEGEGQNDSETAAVEATCQNVQELSLQDGEKEEETKEMQGDEQDSRSPQGESASQSS